MNNEQAFKDAIESEGHFCQELSEEAEFLQQILSNTAIENDEVILMKRTYVQHLADYCERSRNVIELLRHGIVQADSAVEKLKSLCKLLALKIDQEELETLLDNFANPMKEVNGDEPDVSSEEKA